MEIHTRYKKSTLWVKGQGRDRKWHRNDNHPSGNPYAPSYFLASTKKQAQENFKEWRAYLSRIAED